MVHLIAVLGFMRPHISRHIAVIFDEIARSTEDFNGAQVKAVRAALKQNAMSETAAIISSDCHLFTFLGLC